MTPAFADWIVQTQFNLLKLVLDFTVPLMSAWFTIAGVALLFGFAISSTEFKKYGLYLAAITAAWWITLILYIDYNNAHPLKDAILKFDLIQFLIHVFFTGAIIIASATMVFGLISPQQAVHSLIGGLIFLVKKIVEILVDVVKSVVSSIVDVFKPKPPGIK